MAVAVPWAVVTLGVLVVLWIIYFAFLATRFLQLGIKAFQGPPKGRHEEYPEPYQSEQSLLLGQPSSDRLDDYARQWQAGTNNYNPQYYAPQ